MYEYLYTIQYRFSMQMQQFYFHEEQTRTNNDILHLLDIVENHCIWKCHMCDSKCAIITEVKNYPQYPVPLYRWLGSGEMLALGLSLRNRIDCELLKSTIWNHSQTTTQNVCCFNELGSRGSRNQNPVPVPGWLVLAPPKKLTSR